MGKHIAANEPAEVKDYSEFDGLLFEDNDADTRPLTIFPQDILEEEPSVGKPEPTVTQTVAVPRSTNTVVDSPDTQWEAVSVNDLRPGETVRASNDSGTVIFGVVSTQSTAQYPVNIGGVGVEEVGWNFERVIVPTLLPGVPGWYTYTEQNESAHLIFLLDTDGVWHAITKDGSYNVVTPDYITGGGELTPLVRESDVVKAVQARINDTALSPHVKQTVLELLDYEA